MPDFFVWSVPSQFQIVQAASEQDAAEMFLGRQLTPIPSLNAIPVCFVQPADGAETPRDEGAIVEFWLDLPEPTFLPHENG